ncbi:MAG: M23 family metallopeptidase [Verrucomicrobia bacterium]|nr:M23 family metallopeptidase [Verrucomicrobiota bacterium]
MRFLSFRLLVPLGTAWVQHGDSLPRVFELDIGQAKEIRVPGPGGEVRRGVRLLQVEESRWPNWHLAEAPGHAVLRAAEVQVEVGSTRATLWARPFEPPRLVDGLRLYVESTHTWATTPQLDPLVGMTHHVKMSCVAEGMPWGPPELRFPIARFRWQANTYGNTWGALVPYNKLYYHRGEDFGAIPDELEVVASLGGTVIQSPLPEGDGDSNHLRIRHASGLEFAYYHMNLETIPAGLTEGVVVGTGQRLGRTGMTWDGPRSQVNDPHLHWGVFRDGQPLASYPFALEAYLRDYPDSVLAVAGGYHYAMPGEPVELDASRSVARPGDASSATAGCSMMDARSTRRRRWSGRIGPGCTAKSCVSGLMMEVRIATTCNSAYGTGSGAGAWVQAGSTTHPCAGAGRECRCASGPGCGARPHP